MSSSEEELKHLQIPLQDISSATNDFARENYIGLGGFGKVYKGQSEKHGTIAIKRLDRDRGEHGQGDREFKTEIALLSVYKHENIVSLQGFCNEDGEKILVYKFESKGSLDKHLNNTNLTWTQRLRICLDAARGLKYLHDDVAPQHRILHRDVKSANILLDENWKAKISDFGLSRKGPANVQPSFVNSNACGTLGYIDPEYFYTNQLTPKSDVFSFGVVLFEVLCGRPAFVTVDGQFFFVWVQKHYKRRTLRNIIHSCLHEQINPASILTFSAIAYQCLINGEERPTMEKVVEQLQKALENQLAPSGSQSHVYNDDGFVAHHKRQLGYLDTNRKQPIRAKPSSSRSSPATSESRKYDVFISFRGEDTRKSFVDHLYSALARQLDIFKDDEVLIRGELTGPSLFKAIKESKIAIIIFSENYAESRWCLDELAYIMECSDTMGLFVIPVFYHVKPSEVRKQNRSYGEAFARHESNNIEKVQSWRNALKNAAGLSGFKVTGHEAKAVEEIVYAVIHRLLSLTPPEETSAQTGLSGSQSHVYNDDGFVAHHQRQSGYLDTKHKQPIRPRLSTTSESQKYDVFISFRGADTRETFVDHLYSALAQFVIYKEGLVTGELIDSSVFKTIKESKIAIIIFSKNYASSTWCLDELAYIMECRDKIGLLVLPVFYHVEPMEVRRQSWNYGEALAGHELNNIEKVQHWRYALKYAAGLSGIMVTGHEAKAVEEIVYTVTHRLLSLMPPEETSAQTNAETTGLIGIETRIHDLKSLLEIGSSGVLMVGICGTWGSGKSTLASSIYDEISHEYEGCCFIKNVRAEARMHGLKTLQEKILSGVYKSKVMLESIQLGVFMMTKRLRRNRVLIVLDDVDHVDHLQMLAGSHEWFGDGSRVIFTTRNHDLVNAHNCITHNVRMLDVEEAIELFSWHAFGTVRPVEGYEELSRSIVSKFGGHPSTLMRLGSFLQDKDMSEWTRIFARLEGIPFDEILEKFNAGDDGVSRDYFSWICP